MSVNAAIPENQGQAYLVRLRDAMNDEGAPDGLQDRVRGFVENETHPGARTFADEDGLAIMDITQEKSPFSGDPPACGPSPTPSSTPLSPAAPASTLCAARENTDTLRDEFGGLAGLTRF